MKVNWVDALFIVAIASLLVILIGSQLYLLGYNAHKYEGDFFTIHSKTCK